MKIGFSATTVQGGRSGVAQYTFSLLDQLSRIDGLKLSVFALRHERPLFDFLGEGLPFLFPPDEG